MITPEGPDGSPTSPMPEGRPSSNVRRAPSGETIERRPLLGVGVPVSDTSTFPWFESARPIGLRRSETTVVPGHSWAEASAAKSARTRAAATARRVTAARPALTRRPRPRGGTTAKVRDGSKWELIDSSVWNGGWPRLAGKPKGGACTNRARRAPARRTPAWARLRRGPRSAACPGNDGLLIRKCLRAIQGGGRDGGCAFGSRAGITRRRRHRGDSAGPAPPRAACPTGR